MLSFCTMRALNLKAHFDGEHIRLDEPCELEPETPLMVTVLPKDRDEDPERFALAGLELGRAYADDEPDYPLELIKEPNPDSEGR